MILYEMCSLQYFLPACSLSSHSLEEHAFENNFLFMFCSMADQYREFSLKYLENNCLIREIEQIIFA